MSEAISAEAFAALAAGAGMRLDQDELALLREGYIGLQALLARLPADPPLPDEPAFVQVLPGCRVVR